MSPPSTLHGINKLARHGWTWFGIEQFAQRALTMIVSLVLARLLDPSVFGLVASVGIFFAIASNIIDGGISYRVIQKPVVTETDYCALFWCNGAMSLFCATALLLSANSISVFLDDAQLKPIVIAFAGIIFMMFAGRVHEVRLVRDGRFRTLATIRLSSVVAGCILGIVLALSGFGVWALLGQQATFAATRSLALWIIIPWQPKSRPSWASIRDLYGYGVPVMSAQVLRTAADHLINLIIAKRISLVALGFFDRGRVIPKNLGDALGNTFTQTNFPLLSKLQDDHGVFQGTYLRFLTTSTSITFMIMAGLALSASDLVLIVLGPKWLPSVWFLQAQCVASCLLLTFNANADLLRTKGNTSLLLRYSSLASLLNVVGVVAGVPWGAQGMVIGSIIAGFVAVISIMIALSRKRIISLTQQLRVVASSFTGAVLLAAMLFLLRLAPLSLWPRFVASGLLGLCALFVSLRLFDSTGRLKYAQNATADETGS